MSMNRVLSSEPERMTTRARLYLLATGLFNGIFAWCCFFSAGWDSASYDSIKLVAALPVWGVGFAIVGALALGAAASKDEGTARLAAGLAALLTGTWAFGFLAAAYLGTLQGPSGPLSWSLLTTFHLLQVASPLRLPLEPILRRLNTKR